MLSTNYGKTRKFSSSIISSCKDLGGFRIPDLANTVYDLGAYDATEIVTVVDYCRNRCHRTKEPSITTIFKQLQCCIVWKRCGRVIPLAYILVRFLIQRMRSRTQRWRLVLQARDNQNVSVVGHSNNCAKLMASSFHIERHLLKTIKVKFSRFESELFSTSIWQHRRAHIRVVVLYRLSEFWERDQSIPSQL